MSAAKIILGDAPSPIRVTAVIVLYKMAPEESPAFCSLMDARDKLRPREGRVHILLWDNSSNPHPPGERYEDVEYFQDRSNPGLACAYNWALEMAKAANSQWFITLDQDTVVPRDYLVSMFEAARRCAGRAGVGAIVPQIAMRSKPLSPYRLALGAIPRWFRPGFHRVAEHAVFAFNSGAMMRVSVLEQVGGYDRRFPLDHSDTALFHKLHTYGKRIYIAGNVQLKHRFSMTDMNHSMSADRYRESLMAESGLWDLHLNWLAGCERTCRLMMRMVRHWVRNDGADLRGITQEFLLFRLFRSKRFRIRHWEARAGRQLDSSAGSSHKGNRRPRVSVCMAAFNGGKFIEAQLNSILPQLAEGDEVVIVDDCSLDDTIAQVRKHNDNRIRLLTHEQNEGVVATFEDALRSATGEILFLCDDDDLWALSKVEQVVEAFRAQPDAQIVISKSALIDEDGAHQPDGRINRYGNFTPGFWRNLYMNHYQGSAMAIRASLLGCVLPLPRRKLFLHDAWIGTRSELTGGRTVFIDQPLLYYRRHAQNASRTYPLTKQIRIRIELLMAHLSHAFQITSL